MSPVKLSAWIKKTRTSVIAITAAAGFFSCYQPHQPEQHPSEPQAIHNGFRSTANADQLVWTISLNGCAGSFIAPDMVLTANHCLQSRLIKNGPTLTSGSALAKGRRNDFEFINVLEEDSELDYAILKVKAVTSFPEDQVIIPFLATNRNMVTTGKNPDEGDLLFSVGFPIDKNPELAKKLDASATKDSVSSGDWVGYYASGRAKGVEQVRFIKENKIKTVFEFNIPIIDGNSGGGVLTQNDKRLVSLTNEGRKEYKEDGWFGGSKNNPEKWDWGPPMWEIYRRSAILQQQFDTQTGKNKLNANWKADPVFKVRSNYIFSALSSEELQPKTYLQYFAVGVTNQKTLTVCYNIKPQDCKKGNPNAFEANRLQKINDQQIYRIKLQPLEPLQDHSLTVVLWDNNDQIVAQRILRFRKKSK